MIRNHKKFFHLIHHHRYLTSKISTSATTCNNKSSSNPPSDSPPPSKSDDTSNKNTTKSISKNHHHIDNDEFNRIVKKWKHSLGMETAIYKTIRDSAVFSLNQFNKIMDKIVDEAIRQHPKMKKTFNHTLQDCSLKLQEKNPKLMEHATKINEALDKVFVRLCGGLNKKIFNDSRVNEVREDLKKLSIGAIERAIQAAKELQAKIDTKPSHKSTHSNFQAKKERIKHLNELKELVNEVNAAIEKCDSLQGKDKIQCLEKIKENHDDNSNKMVAHTASTTAADSYSGIDLNNEELQKTIQNIINTNIVMGDLEAKFKSQKITDSPIVVMPEKQSTLSLQEKLQLKKVKPTEIVTSLIDESKTTSKAMSSDYDPDEYNRKKSKVMSQDDYDDYNRNTRVNDNYDEYYPKKSKVISSDYDYDEYDPNKSKVMSSDYDHDEYNPKKSKVMSSDYDHDEYHRRKFKNSSSGYDYAEYNPKKSKVISRNYDYAKYNSKKNKAMSNDYDYDEYNEKNKVKSSDHDHDGNNRKKSNSIFDIFKRMASCGERKKETYPFIYEKDDEALNLEKSEIRRKEKQVVSRTLSKRKMDEEKQKETYAYNYEEDDTAINNEETAVSQTSSSKRKLGIQIKPSDKDCGACKIGKTKRKKLDEIDGELEDDTKMLVRDIQGNMKSNIDSCEPPQRIEEEHMEEHTPCSRKQKPPTKICSKAKKICKPGDKKKLRKLDRMPIEDVSCGTQPEPCPEPESEPFPTFKSFWKKKDPCKKPKPKKEPCKKLKKKDPCTKSKPKDPCPKPKSCPEPEPSSDPCPEPESEPCPKPKKKKKIKCPPKPCSPVCPPPKRCPESKPCPPSPPCPAPEPCPCPPPCPEPEPCPDPPPCPKPKPCSPCPKQIPCPPCPCPPPCPQCPKSEPCPKPEPCVCPAPCPCTKPPCPKPEPSSPPCPPKKKKSDPCPPKINPKSKTCSESETCSQCNDCDSSNNSLCSDLCIKKPTPDPKTEPCSKSDVKVDSCPKKDPCIKPDPCAKPKPKEDSCPKSDPRGKPESNKDPCAKPKPKEDSCPKSDPCGKPESNKDPCAKPKPKKDPCAKQEKEDPFPKPEKKPACSKSVDSGSKSERKPAVCNLEKEEKKVCTNDQKGFGAIPETKKISCNEATNKSTFGACGKEFVEAQKTDETKSKICAGDDINRSFKTTIEISKSNKPNSITYKICKAAPPFELLKKPELESTIQKVCRVEEPVEMILNAEEKQIPMKKFNAEEKQFTRRTMSVDSGSKCGDKDVCGSKPEPKKEVCPKGESKPEQKKEVCQKPEPKKEVCSKSEPKKEDCPKLQIPKPCSTKDPCLKPEPKKEACPKPEPKKEACPKPEPKKEACPKSEPKKEVCPKPEPKEKVCPKPEQKTEVCPKSEPPDPCSTKDPCLKPEPKKEVCSKPEPKKEVFPKSEPCGNKDSCNKNKSTSCADFNDNPDPEDGFKSQSVSHAPFYHFEQLQGPIEKPFRITDLFKGIKMFKIQSTSPPNETRTFDILRTILMTTEPHSGATSSTKQEKVSGQNKRLKTAPWLGYKSPPMKDTTTTVEIRKNLNKLINKNDEQLLNQILKLTEKKMNSVNNLKQSIKKNLINTQTKLMIEKKIKEADNLLQIVEFIEVKIDNKSLTQQKNIDFIKSQIMELKRTLEEILKIIEQQESQKLDEARLLTRVPFTKDVIQNHLDRSSILISKQLADLHQLKTIVDIDTGKLTRELNIIERTMNNNEEILNNHSTIKSKIEESKNLLTKNYNDCLNIIQKHTDDELKLKESVEREIEKLNNLEQNKASLKSLNSSICLKQDVELKLCELRTTIHSLNTLIEAKLQQSNQLIKNNLLIITKLLDMEILKLNRNQLETITSSDPNLNRNQLQSIINSEPSLNLETSTNHLDKGPIGGQIRLKSERMGLVKVPSLNTKKLSDSNFQSVTVSAANDATTDTTFVEKPTAGVQIGNKSTVGNKVIMKPLKPFKTLHEHPFLTSHLRLPD